MWQTVVVGLIVLIAAAYALWALMPAVLRLGLARRLAVCARRAGRPQWLVRTTAALERVALRGGGACSECGAVQSKSTRPKRLDKA